MVVGAVVAVTVLQAKMMPWVCNISEEFYWKKVMKELVVEDILKVIEKQQTKWLAHLSKRRSFKYIWKSKIERCKIQERSRDVWNAEMGSKWTNFMHKLIIVN